MSDLCEELGFKIVVCSTHEDAWLFKNVKRKTDKDDAIKLARLASMKQLVATHVPAKAIRERRRLSEAHKINQYSHSTFPKAIAALTSLTKQTTSKN